jgi:6-pyruvoyltetrahydropterin/6-carboxytetrahydropterin synthase
MVLITRRAEFSASHYCAHPSLTDEQNAELYGAASRPSGHGHNYVLEVTVGGEVDPVNGMIMDLKRLKEIINEQVVETYDHRFLNHEVPPFDKIVPTAENIARDIWERLAPHVNDESRRLHLVRLYETSDLYVDYAGEAGEAPRDPAH